MSKQDYQQEILAWCIGVKGVDWNYYFYFPIIYRKYHTREEEGRLKGIEQRVELNKGR